MIRALVILFMLNACARAGILLNTNIALPFPANGAWSAVVPNQPADNTVATINPPKFMWTYTAQASNSVADQGFKRFTFEIANNTNMTSPILTVHTDDNFYNFVGPLSVGDWYWRVTRYDATTGSELLEEVSGVRRFTIPSGIEQWDRSMFTNSTYMTRTHPYIMLNASTRLSISNNIFTNALIRLDVFQFLVADALVSLGWPNERLVKSDTGDDMTDAQWAEHVGAVALMWQLTRNPAYSNCAAAVTALATNFVLEGRTEADAISGDPLHPALALGYDWMYDSMNSVERAYVAKVIGDRSFWIRQGSGAFPLNGTYGTGVGSGPPSHNKAGFSHDIENFNTSMLGALATYQENTNSHELMMTGLNYWFGPTYCYGIEGDANQGRGYGSTVLNFESSLYRAMMQFEATFTNNVFTRNPWVQRNVKWWNYMVPAGFTQRHEPWGDGGYGRDQRWFGYKMFRDQAWLSRNVEVMDHYVGELASWGYTLANVERVYDYEKIAFFPYFHEGATNSYTPETGALFEVGGWSFGYGAPATTTNAINSIGFILSARAGGSENGHSAPHNGSLQLFKNGVSITDAGVEGLAEGERAPHFQNVPLVDGYGNANPYTYPIEPFYGYHTHFTNNAHFAFAGVETAPNFPRTVFSYSAGGGAGAGYVNSHSTGAMRDLRKVRTYLLTEKDAGYFLLRREYSAVTNFLYIGTWHILEEPFNLGTNGNGLPFFSYSCTNDAGTMVVTNDVIWVTQQTNLSFRVLSGVHSAENPYLPGNFGGPDSHPWARTVFTELTRATNGDMTCYIVARTNGQPAATVIRIDDYTSIIDVNGFRHTNSFDATYSGAVKYQFDLASEPASFTEPQGGSQITETVFRGVRMRGVGVR